MQFLSHCLSIQKRWTNMVLQGKSLNVFFLASTNPFNIYYLRSANI